MTNDGSGLVWLAFEPAPPVVLQVERVIWQMPEKTPLPETPIPSHAVFVLGPKRS